VEPVGRDTSACLGFCALHIERRDPQAAMLAVPADHHIADGEAFRRTLRKGMENLPGATAVVFGIRPARPDTGYGYVETGAAAGAAEVLPVIRFVEKPDARTAARYLAAGNFYWNSGMFLWRNATLLELFARHMPDTHRGLERIRSLMNGPHAPGELARVYAALPRISVDYGILEKASGLRLVPAEFDWDDIGNWTALERILPADAQGNVAVGPLHALEAGGCITYSDAGHGGTVRRFRPGGRAGARPRPGLPQGKGGGTEAPRGRPGSRATMTRAYKIAFRRIPGFSRIFLQYLDLDPAALAFYQVAPAPEALFDKAREIAGRAHFPARTWRRFCAGRTGLSAAARERSKTSKPWPSRAAWPCSPDSRSAFSPVRSTRSTRP
jgi:mannose-1-phosphate guanylyltransferase